MDQYNYSEIPAARGWPDYRSSWLLNILASGLQVGSVLMARRGNRGASATMLFGSISAAAVGEVYRIKAAASPALFIRKAQRKGLLSFGISVDHDRLDLSVSGEAFPVSSR